MDKNWDDFSSPVTDELEKKYLPDQGEGDTKATQAVTATAKLIYKWFNDGDVYDNSYDMKGWANDISTYANWLHANVDGADLILDRIKHVSSDEEYVNTILWPLYTTVFDEGMLAVLEKESKVDSVYSCRGPFVYHEGDYEDDDYEDDDYDDDYADDYEYDSDSEDDDSEN